jgi:TM2 domain-containing membrane protein YozV
MKVGDDLSSPIVFEGDHTMNQQQKQNTNQKPKSQLLYILLGITVGCLGIHNFYVGRRAEGVCQLVLFLLLFWTVIVPVILMCWSVYEVCTVTRDGDGRMMS